MVEEAKPLSYEENAKLVKQQRSIAAANDDEDFDPNVEIWKYLRYPQWFCIWNERIRNLAWRETIIFKQ